MKKGVIILLLSLACFFAGTKIMDKWNPYGSDHYLEMGLGLWAVGAIGILILIVAVIKALSWSAVSIKLREDNDEDKFK